MTTGKYLQRFAIGSSDGPRSNIWVVKATKKNDVYVTIRSAVGLYQFSFHQSGVSHLKLPDGTTRNRSQHVARKSRYYDDDARHAGNLDPLITITVLTELLVKAEDDRALPNVRYLEPSPGGVSKLIVLRNRILPKTLVEQLSVPSGKMYLVDDFELISGERLLVVLHHDEGEFDGFKIPPSHGQLGWITPPTSAKDKVLSGRAVMCPSEENSVTYQVSEFGGAYFDAFAFSTRSAKYFHKQ